MRDKIKSLLEQALQHQGKYASGELSDELYMNIVCDAKNWCVDMVACENSASRICFNAEIYKGKIELESIVVSKEFQRKGIGSLLFSGMLEIIEVMNGELIKWGYPENRVIEGELRPYDAPFDQYDKSIPFYMKQAENHNLDLQFFEEDKETFQRKDISYEEALGFIDTWRCGGFRYSMKK